MLADDDLSELSDSEGRRSAMLNQLRDQKGQVPFSPLPLPEKAMAPRSRAARTRQRVTRRMSLRKQTTLFILTLNEIYGCHAKPLWLSARSPPSQVQLAAIGRAFQLGQHLSRAPGTCSNWRPIIEAAAQRCSYRIFHRNSQENPACTVVFPLRNRFLS